MLSAIQNPLLAVDLKGHTLFYNEAFENDVLTLGVLKNQIRLAEEYFLEIIRNLIFQKPPAFYCLPVEAPAFI